MWQMYLLTPLITCSHPCQRMTRSPESLLLAKWSASEPHYLITSNTAVKMHMIRRLVLFSFIYK